MRFKQVMIALGKAACYTLLFIGTQLFVSYAAAVFMGIRSGLQILSGDSAPEAGALAKQMADTLLGNAMLLTLISNALTLLILLPVFAAQKKVMRGKFPSSLLCQVPFGRLFQAPWRSRLWLRSFLPCCPSRRN